MDSLFKYPLFRAHKNQVEAEEKELRGDISSAVRLREEALSNLHLAFKSTTQECVRRNLQLQINHEDNQLERLRLHEKETKKLIESLKLTVRETQAEGVKREPSSDILDNANAMENLLTEMEAKLNIVCENFLQSKSDIPKVNNSAPHKVIPLKEDEELENLQTHVKDILSLTRAGHEIHSKNMRLIRMLLNSYCALKTDYETLQVLVHDTHGAERKSRAGGIDTGEEALSTVNISLSASTPPAIVDLVPLESPPLDFLNKRKIIL